MTGRRAIGWRICHAGMALILVTGVLRGQVTETPARVSDNSTVVFLVRHAEKEKVGRDPELTEVGRTRARQLAKLLKTAKLDHVHTSDFRRTRGTAEPVATAQELELDIYSPFDLPSLVDRIRSDGGRHLVVGHSNTTPDMVRRLGGDAGKPIDEQTEFDRLYVVTLFQDGSVSTVQLHYGE